MARRNLNALIVLDCIATVTAETADILIPVAAWPERGGTFVNYEGRTQGFAPVFRRLEYQPSTADVIADLAYMLENPLKDTASVLHNAIPGFVAPSPGAAGSHIKAPKLPIPVTAPMQSVEKCHDSGWQAALTSWIGDEALAGFAPELAKLAPADVALINPDAALNNGIQDGSRIILRSPTGSVEMPAQHNPAVASQTVSIPRNVLTRLGIGHGDPLELAQVL